MKRVNNLYKTICDIDKIMDMYDHSIRHNTKNKQKIEEFDDYYSANIKMIKEELVNKTYIPGKYNIFLIKEPKVRVIMSQEIKDKIINHLVAKYFLINVFDKNLISRNCATRVNKGTHYAMKLFCNDYNYFLNRYHTFYVLKMDISKYFYNLDHQIIKDIIKNKIKDKSVLDILDLIINSTNETYINETINILKNNEIKRIKNSNSVNKEKRIREIENLPSYEKGKGLCIGNMVSQIIATFYLDGLDKYITHELGFKHYARYMDDFYIMSENKEKLKSALDNISLTLKRDYRLKLNNKTKIYKSSESIEFLGFRYTSKKGNIKKTLTTKTKKRFKGKMQRLNKELKGKNISFREYRTTRDSYKGHLSYGSCYNIFSKYVEFPNIK